MNAADELETVRTYQESPVGSTARETAFLALLDAHQGAIITAARRSTTLEPDDARAEALAAFVEALETFDLELGFRLSTHAYGAMHRAVIAASTQDQKIVVPQHIVMAYTKLMRKHDGDFPAAYAAARLGGEGISPGAMLATYRAFQAGVEFESTVLGDGVKKLGSQGAVNDLADRGHARNRIREFGRTDDEPHAEIHYEFVDYLFSVCTDDQAQVIRMVYGFDPDALERAAELDVKAGDSPAILADRAVGILLGKSRGQIQRARTSGLRSMKSVVQASLDAEAAA